MLEDGEVFDSTLLKETINSFIASGKRNVVIDLMQLDYIYSDSINVIMALNKRITDVGGCLALLSPRPEVVQILQKTGIYNALRVFNLEEEVLRASEDMMTQSAAPTGSQPNESLSEFDQLRSEIGSVFGGTNSGSQSNQNEYFSTSGQSDPTSNQEFTGNVNRFGNESEAPFLPNVPQQPAQRPVPPQGPFTRPGFPNQQPQFQSRQFTPPVPPPISQPRSMVPPPVQNRGFDGAQKPPARPAYSADSGKSVSPEYSSETQRFQSVPQSPPKSVKKPEPPISLSFDEELEEITPSGKKFQSQMPVGGVESLDGEEDLLQSESIRKKSPVLILSLVAILFLAVVGGILFGYMNFLKKPQASLQTPEIAKNTVETKSVAGTSVPGSNDLEIENAANTVKQVEQPPVEPTEIVTEQPSVTKKKIASKPVKQERVVKTKPEPVMVEKSQPDPVQKKAVVVNKVYVNSVPTGATVMINGDRIGKTPLTWDKPVFGPLSIELTKPGFKPSSKDLEFTGGVLSESFTLEKDAPAPLPKPVVQEPVRQIRQEPVADLQLEPEPQAVPEPVRAPAPVATSSGDASIFIASIPPVADVYLNGKLVGRTNLSEIKLPSGTLTLRFVKGPKEVTQEITLQPGKNPSRLVRLP